MNGDPINLKIAELYGYIPSSDGCWVKDDETYAVSSDKRNHVYALPVLFHSHGIVRACMRKHCITAEMLARFEQNLRWVLCEHKLWPTIDMPAWVLLTAGAEHEAEALVKTLA